MDKKTICFTLLTFFMFCATARADLTQPEIQRLTKAKALLMETEPRAIHEIIAEFEQIGSAREQLMIYEAVAATFHDIHKEYGKDDPQAREQLLGKIRLNMAYFQLGGPAGETKGMGELNRLIRRKLKDYLPKKIWTNPNLFHSLD